MRRSFSEYVNRAREHRIVGGARRGAEPAAGTAASASKNSFSYSFSRVTI
jgi:hypothetical protein